MNESPRCLYESIGGAAIVRRLVEAFYDIVENEPAGQELMLLHMRGHGIAHSRVEQFNFLCGFLGGPRLYEERHGHASLRQMHEHVEIDKRARDAWLACMAVAIDRAELPPDAGAEVMHHFERVTEILINKH
ncbi:MAG: group II truncated hemoglobin [Hyphomicrobiaceae bacterium]